MSEINAEHYQGLTKEQIEKLGQEIEKHPIFKPKKIEKTKMEMKEHIYYVSYTLIWRVKPEKKFKIARLVFAKELEVLKQSLNVKNLTIEEVES